MAETIQKLFGYANERYDNNGKLIYREFSDFTQQWLKDGKVIREKSPKDEETIYDYDDNGNLIHYKSDNGTERWFDYDNKGYVTHIKDQNGHEEWFDKNGNVSYIKDPIPSYITTTKII